MNNSIRLQVFLSQRGLASRRHAAEMIKAGRVRINDRIVNEPGWRVNPLSDHVFVDQREVAAAPPPLRTLVLYKPVGILCSADSSQGRTVLDIAGPPNRNLRLAGRLDKDSEGLVILSNDGDLILRLTHPRFNHRKRYQVEVEGRLDKKVLNQLRSPIDLDGYRTRPAKVERIGGHAGRHTLLFRLGEGRNRQIRRLCARSSLTVARLIRVAIGPVEIGGLRPGEWRELTSVELARIAPSK